MPAHRFGLRRTRRAGLAVACGLAVAPGLPLHAAPAAGLPLRPAAALQDATGLVSPAHAVDVASTVQAAQLSAASVRMATVGRDTAAGTTATASPSAAVKSGSNGNGGTCTLWTEPSNDDESEIKIAPLPPVGTLPVTPSIDLTEETMSTAPDGSTLVIRIYVVDLEKQVPFAYSGISWTTVWSIDGGTIFARAIYTPDGVTRFYFGPSLVPVPGSLVTGPGGYAEFDVPPTAPGAPAAGSVLYWPSATAGYDRADVNSPLVGWSSVGSGGGDSAGPQNNYVMGTHCG